MLCFLTPQYDFFPASKKMKAIMNAGSVELFKNKKKAARHKPNSLLV